MSMDVCAVMSSIIIRKQAWLLFKAFFHLPAAAITDDASLLARLTVSSSSSSSKLLISDWYCV